MAHGDARLLHRRGGKRREADDVACGVDAGDRGAVVRVDLHVAALVEGNADLVETELLGAAHAARGEEKLFGDDGRAARELARNASGDALHFSGRDPELDVDAEPDEGGAKAL